MINISIGVGLVAIALTAQWILNRRLKHAAVSRAYSWIAWVCAYLGGAAVTVDLAHRVGITASGAAVAAFLMLLVIVADLADRRPDWPAFILIILAPTFMRLAVGDAGELYAVLLAPADAALRTVGPFLGTA
jgi:vacuolar-type H+-ATPase subunit I/STV1